MKKFLLSLAAIFSLGFAANADIVEAFDGTGDTTWPTSFTTGTAWTQTSSTTDIEYTSMGCKYYSSGYLMFNTKTQKDPKAYLQFELPIKCSAIVVTTSSGNSTNANNKLNLYCDGTLAETVAINKTSSDFTFTITGDAQEAGTVYKLEGNSTSYNSQITKLTFVQASSEASLTTNVESLSFASVLNASASQTVKVIAANVTGDITAVSSNANFKVDSTISQTDAAAGVTVTYVGNTAGTEDGTITFTAGDLTAKILVSGITAAHEGTEEDPLSVSDVYNFNNANSGTFYVKGKIAGCCANAVDGMIQITDTYVDTNVVLTDVDNDAIAVGVALNSGDTRTTMGLSTTEGAVLGQTVIVQGQLTAYFGAPGVKSAEYISGIDTSGVEEINVDSNAAVEYFNLQGVRVANPSTGLYIRRQGNAISKVVIK